MSSSDQQTYAPVAAAAAAQYNVPTSLFQWQMGQESSWNPNASNGNAQGIAQFIPSTAAAFHVDVNDPVSSIYGAAAYDAQLYSQYGDWSSVLSHYGTVRAKSPQSVIDAANAQLTAVGAAPIATGSNSANSASASASPSSPSLADTVTAALKNVLPWNTAGAAGSSTSNESIFDIGAGRIGYMAVGLILIAGGLYLLKPVQSVVNTTAAQGVKSGLKHAGKTALAAVSV